MKATIFHNNKHNNNKHISKLDITPEECRQNLKHIHTTITSQYLSSRKNKVTNITLYDIHSLEQTLPRHMRTKLARLRANKSPLLEIYLHTVNSKTYTPQCPLCLSHINDTNHLFNCSQLQTQHKTTSLRKKPLEAAEVIQKWKSRLSSFLVRPKKYLP